LSPPKVIESPNGIILISGSAFIGAATIIKLVKNTINITKDKNFLELNLKDNLSHLNKVILMKSRKIEETELFFEIVITLIFG
jgi:hypothetical protein